MPGTDVLIGVGLTVLSWAALTYTVIRGRRTVNRLARARTSRRGDAVDG
ncbi:hypothetical protein [Haloarcula onubensis]|uniref:CcmD family protein n=1 Tax=Haloarcula onubensis TaxID=2950539 RepID=A0ABU2FPM2_9EURY|nr:hypothetical protein [Halomicroarcula sp. S3CR25-11]MDS0282704.1 hypothetical protein [Halomicroarcula sp. S3CR25-11]